MIGLEALQSAFQLDTVEPHEEDHAKFTITKPTTLNADGSLKRESDRPSDNFVERAFGEEGDIIDIYINSPWGSFSAIYHLLSTVSETDKVNIYLNSGIYSEDARLILSSMSICRSPITVHIGYITGLYSACVAISGTECKYNKLSAIEIASPLEFLTLRGIGEVQRQIGYIENSVKQYSDLLISKGLLSKEETDNIILNNKQVLLKRDTLAKRLSNISST